MCINLKTEKMKKLDSLINFCLAALITAAVYYLFRLDFEYLILVFLASYPWKFGKNIWSLFGGINNDGSIYSLISLFQIANNDATCLFGVSLFQRANGNAICVIGLLLFQQADNNANCVIGISLGQKAGKNASIGFGLSVSQ